MCRWSSSRPPWWLRAPQSASACCSPPATARAPRRRRSARAFPRWSSTWACAPTRRPSRCGGPRRSTRPGRLPRPRGSSAATPHWRRSSARPSPPGPRGRSRSSSGSQARTRATREVLLNLGLARYWAGHDSEALAAWRLAAAAGPDNASGVRANDLLHPSFPRGLPYVVSSYAPPVAVTTLPPSQQLAELAHRAETGTYRDKLIYGIALQRLGHPLSAERQFAAAAVLAPNDPEAQVAAAVGRFSKANPSLAFSKLGPLAQQIPALAGRPLPSRPAPAVARAARTGPRAAAARGRRRAGYGARQGGGALPAEPEGDQIALRWNGPVGLWRKRPARAKVPHPRKIMRLHLK